MEKASGELSLTVVTVLAVAALAGIIAIVAPQISGWIQETFNNATGAPADLTTPTDRQ